MKTKNFLFSAIFGVALSAAVLTGCKKDTTPPAAPASTDSDYTAAQDETNATNISNDSKSVSDAAVTQGSSTALGPVSLVSSTFTVTFYRTTDTNSLAEDTMYINFGPTPVLCHDGKYREGEIIVYWSNKIHSVWRAYFDSGSTVYMTFRNYARGALPSNMVEINGTRNWTNNGGQISINNVDCENWSFSANLTLIYLATKDTATWTSTRTNTLVNESGTWYYKITGSASGKSHSGVLYNLTISEPLYHTAIPCWLQGGCPWIEAGQVQITRTGKTNTLTIDFGTIGDCNSQATAEIGGKSYTFTMW